MRKLAKFLILISLILTTAACREKIVHNLSEREANRLLTRLDQIDIHSKRIKQPDGRWALAVTSSEVLRALKHLSDTKLLREPVVFQENTTMLSSREERNFRFERALSREIEYTLESMSGVLQARVHLNLVTEDPFLGKNKTTASGSAAVLIITDKNLELTGEHISRLVAGASGVKTDQISVLVTKHAVDFSKEQLINKSSSQKQPLSSNRTRGLKKYLPTRIHALLLSQKSLFLQIAASLLVLGLGVLYFCFSLNRRNELRPNLGTSGTEWDVK